MNDNPEQCWWPHGDCQLPKPTPLTDAEVMAIAKEAGWQNTAILMVDMPGLKRFATLVLSRTAQPAQEPTKIEAWLQSIAGNETANKSARDAAKHLLTVLESNPVAAHPPQQVSRDDMKDAERWRAFRSRDEFQNLDFTDFREQFREDADAVIDAAMSAKKEPPCQTD